MCCVTVCANQAMGIILNPKPFLPLGFEPSSTSGNSAMGGSPLSSPTLGTVQLSITAPRTIRRRGQACLCDAHV